MSAAPGHFRIIYDLDGTLIEGGGHVDEKRWTWWCGDHIRHSGGAAVLTWAIDIATGKRGPSDIEYAAALEREHRELFTSALDAAISLGLTTRTGPPMRIVRVPCDEPIVRSWVYLLSSSGLLKIGFTRVGVWARVRGLQVGCPTPIVIVASFAGSRDDERAAHAELRAHRVRGEWFADVPDVRDYFARRRA